MCSSDLSQIQNRAAAMRVLQSRLLLLKQQEEDAKKKELAGDIKASWGDQMRSYVLNPYQMVKDLRTSHEVGNPEAVFDERLDATRAHVDPYALPQTPVRRSRLRTAGGIFVEQGLVGLGRSGTRLVQRTAQITAKIGRASCRERV